MSKRIIGLDIFRLTAVMFVFLFHANIHLGINFGIFNDLVNMGAIFMTGFFLMSGYVLYYIYSNRNLTEIGNIKNFYLKRVIGILPIYYVISLVWQILYGSETLIQNILLAPIETLTLQSVFATLFPVSHNSGTWFVSCIFICYVVYPYIQLLITQISDKLRIFLMVLFIFILLWAPLVQLYFGLISIYSNPFFRLLEFTIGILLCSLRNLMKKHRITKYLISKMALAIECVILWFGVTLAVKINIPKDYMLYSWIALPMFILMIISLSEMHFKKNNYPIINYLCNISYVFFFAKFFTWKTTRFIISEINMNNNIIIVLISLAICLSITILIHELLEKPLTMYLNKKIMKY